MSLNANLLAPLATQITAVLERAWDQAIAAGALPALPTGATPDFAVSPTPPAKGDGPALGDYGSAVAFKLAKPLDLPAPAIATALANTINELGDELVASASATANGFLNVSLAPAALAARVAAALAAGPAFGRLVAAKPEHITVEFVSANPTGPLTVGNARGAFVGDLLARLLEAAGHTVSREYYINDRGNQINNLGASILALRDGESLPPDGYAGAYVGELLASLPAELAASSDARAVGFWAAGEVLTGIQASLTTLGVPFDHWTSETAVHAAGLVEDALATLDAAGWLYEEDGGLLFASSRLGDDADRAVRKADGEVTYFGSDLGLLLAKSARSERLIYVWGSDHHGTIARLKNGATALGLDAAAIEVLLVAWVTFTKNGAPVAMSKRTGEFITLDELLAELGTDAARWHFAARSASTSMEIDLVAAVAHSKENPVWSVQYAHARISSVLAKAATAGITPAAAPDAGLLADPLNAGLAKLALGLPGVVAEGAASRTTHGITTYALTLAATFHAWYEQVRVIELDDPAGTASRLALVAAARLALANALGLLGVSAPLHMDSLET